MKCCIESSVLQLYSILDLHAAFPSSSLLRDMVPCAAPVSHYRHWWFSNRLLSFAHHCALTLSLPLATANIHLPPTAWPALISSPCSSECVLSHDLCSPICPVASTITVLARMGFLPTVKQSTDFFFATLINSFNFSSKHPFTRRGHLQFSACKLLSTLLWFNFAHIFTVRTIPMLQLIITISSTD